MAYNCVVLIKQVPDTKRITGQAMNDDGTVNRSALPAIFNPEDLNALELALQIKEKSGGSITVITMGLPAASAVLRDSLFRGADDAILITDRRCAASDTLATSYILSCAVKKIDYDIVLCGRQAIDGDTAQVGPQLAEKLGVPQITYVEELIELNGKSITARRNIGAGWQQVKTALPVLLTVTGDANEPRVAAAKKTMKYKNARTPVEVEKEVRSQSLGLRRKASPSGLVEKTEDRGQKTEDSEAKVKMLIEQKCSDLSEKDLLIKQWDLDYLGADLNWCGRSGSPTKVHRIQSVVLAAKESKDVPANENGISEMIHELIEDKIIS
ncbi:MAG TPA: electron transfer flavoprotein subunit beta/FixA family protein [Sedimentisphaerales bacterium]|nr:electron transfer flavoprotein subunit beta/FixA family protein [Sedimentisphaerales bacterium]